MKPKLPKASVVAVPTGLFWPCPGNYGTAHPTPVALAILRKNKFFVQCPCGSSVFFGRGWSGTCGYTPQQATDMGLVVIT